jgi:hypothetical protein
MACLITTKDELQQIINDLEKIIEPDKIDAAFPVIDEKENTFLYIKNPTELDFNILRIVLSNYDKNFKTLLNMLGE